MGVGKSPPANPEDLQHSWTSAQQGRSAAACQCHTAADFAMAGQNPHAPGQENPRASSMSYSRPSRQNQAPHSGRVGDLVSHLPKQMFGVCSREDCSPWRRKGPLPPPSSLHHIDPELQSRSETSTVDIPCMTEPSRHPLRHSAAGFPSLGILPGCPKQHPQLSCRNHPTPAMVTEKHRWFWEPNCHKGFLCFRIPPHNWMCCSPASPLPCASPLLSRDAAK